MQRLGLHSSAEIQVQVKPPTPHFSEREEESKQVRVSA